MNKTHQFAQNLDPFSRIIYGVWRLGDDADTSVKHVRAKIDACLMQGITTFDHADIYGDYRCEQIFGEAVREDPSLRDKMQTITKCDIVLPSAARLKHYNTSPDYIRKSVENSLARIGVDVIDMLLLHRPDPFMDHIATAGALDGLVREGKVKSVGVSNFKLHDWTLLQSVLETKLVTNQIEISVLATEAFRDGDVAYLQERGVTPMAWSPLAGGELFGGETERAARVMSVLKRLADEQGVAVDAVAYAFLLAHPAGICPVAGTNNVDRIKTLSDAYKVEMDRETWFEIYEASLGTEVP
ncbi:MAG: aldo/keto reductase [Pseudomonadota bacterium]